MSVLGNVESPVMGPDSYNAQAMREVLFGEARANIHPSFHASEHTTISFMSRIKQLVSSRPYTATPYRLNERTVDTGRIGLHAVELYSRFADTPYLDYEHGTEVTRMNFLDWYTQKTNAPDLGLIGKFEIAKNIFIGKDNIAMLEAVATPKKLFQPTRVLVRETLPAGEADLRQAVDLLRGVDNRNPRDSGRYPFATQGPFHRIS